MPVHEYICQLCGKTGTAYRGHGVKPPKFCSRACHNRHNGKALSERSKEARSAIECAACGATFYVPHQRATTAKYCSRSCHSQGQSLSPVLFVVDPVTGCWNWQRGLSANGYGKLWKDGKLEQAHRVAYEAANGPIPERMVIDHLCRTHACVNPDHLEAVTNAENIRRGKRAVLTSEKVRRIKQLAGTMQQKEIAKLFGVNRHHISNILAGRSWKDVV